MRHILASLASSRLCIASPRTRLRSAVIDEGSTLAMFCTYRMGTESGPKLTYNKAHGVKE